MSNSLWEINLLGPVSARREDRSITRFKTRKTAALLGLMAARGGRPQRREEVIALLWPEVEEEPARNRLRLALANLRQNLDEGEAEEAGRVVISDRLEVQLNPGAFTTDVARFEALLETAQRTNDDAQRIECLAQAVDLYRGDLMDGFEDEWIVGERRHLAEAFLLALRRLVKSLAAAGQHERALHYAQRAVQADPLREEAHRALMQLYGAMGRPGEAMRQFRQMERLLREHLDVAPSAQSQNLHSQIPSADAPRAASPRALPPPAMTPPRISVLAHAAPPSSLPVQTPDAEDSIVEPLELPQREIKWSPAPALREQPEQEKSGQQAKNLQEPEQQRTFSAPMAPGATSTGSSTDNETLPRAASFAAPPLYDTRLLGREKDVEQVCEMLLCPETRLVSLTGLGGCGKTRVATEAARRLGFYFPERIAFVPLADVQDASRLWDALAQALRLPGEAAGSREAQVMRTLDGSPALLLLDNTEHLGEAGSLWIAALLERLPMLSCLVTSRQRLNLSREYEYALGPLALPPAAASLPDLLACASVQVFFDRARRVRPSFALTPANAAAVGAVCRALEGLPLALELAAAWTPMLTPAQIQAKLAQRFSLLVSRTLDTPARHRSLQAVLEDSTAMLCPGVQRFFARLSVFCGGWTLDAALQVCEEADALEYLAQLQEHCLLSVREHGEQMRYDWLATVREYAAEQLCREERAALQQRHAEYYREFAESRRACLVGAETTGALDELEAEQSNLRAALAWGMARPPVGARLANILTAYWRVRGHFQEASAWMGQALETADTLPKEVRLCSTGNAGNFAYLRADYAQARACFTVCLDIARQAGDGAGIAHALDSLGNVMQEMGEYTEAKTLLDESITRWRELNSPRHLAVALSHRAIVANVEEDFGSARSLYEESLRLYHAIGQQAQAAMIQTNLAGVLLKMDDAEAALTLLKESVALSQELRCPRSLAYGLAQSVLLLVRQKNFAQAAFVLGQVAKIQQDVPLAFNPRTQSELLAQEQTIKTMLGEAECSGLFRLGLKMCLQDILNVPSEGIVLPI